MRGSAREGLKAGGGEKADPEGRHVRVGPAAASAAGGARGSRAVVFVGKGARGGR